MPWKSFIAVMPSGSATDKTWLDAVGSNISQSYTGAPSGSWQLVQIVPMSPVSEDGRGSLMCYFISGSY
jgi:hypothetical protein